MYSECEQNNEINVKEINIFLTLSSLSIKLIGFNDILSLFTLLLSYQQYFAKQLHVAFICTHLCVFILKSDPGSAVCPLLNEL